MIQTVGAASELLGLRIKVNPGNVDLVPGNPDYETRRAAMLAIREAKYAVSLQTQAAGGELGPMPGDDTRDQAVIAAEAGRFARRDFDVAAVLGGWGLDKEGIFYHGVDITYEMDDSVLLGDAVPEGGHELSEVFGQLQALTPA